MIRIAKNLVLPDDVATQSLAILARRGAGKTYTASVLVEEVIGAKVPVVVLDPTGAWWGLRTSADGERPGLPVVIFGGDHGDVPLEPTAGKVIADVVLEHPGAYVVDLSSFESKSSEVRFAGDFLERLYRGKKRETGPLLLVVDEADVFAPQRPGPEQTRTLGALEAIVRRARIKGLGDLLITQRAAVLNKNVLTQTEVLIVMQTTGPQDRAAIDEWISGNATRDQRDVVLESLASLERGEAWVWSPSWLKLLQRVRIRQRRTFDSSRTPEVGETAIEPRAFAVVDLDKLGARIRATVDQAKANDPAELRKQIAALKRELEQRPTEKVVETVERIVEVPVLNGQVKELEVIAVGLQQAADEASAVGANILAAIGRVTQTSTREREERAPRGVPAAPARGRGDTAVATLAPAAPRRDPAPTIPDGEVKLGKGERTVLGVLRQWPSGRTYNELAFLAGYSANASTLGVILSKLRQAGYVAAGNQPVILTSEGLDAAGGAEELPSGQALLEHWLRHPRMGKGERDVLRVLIETYPRTLSNDELCELTGYSPTASTIGVILSKLRKLGLVEKDARRLAPEFAEAIA